jgi:hypothetical protein
MLKIKLFAIAVFLFLAACAFLFPGSKIEAQSSENAKKRDETLEKVAAYKLWKQVQKPESKSLDLLKSDTISIADSTAMG